MRTTRLPLKLTIKGEGTLVATGDVELEEHGPGVTTAHVHAGIGGANNACGTIVIESGTIRATGAQSLFAPSDSSSDTIGAAGIGGHGHYGKGGSISITGGTVSATGGERAAGIGGGNGGGATVSISGGIVSATGGANAASIGSGNDPSSGSRVSITGGTITCNATIGSGFVRNDEHATVSLGWTDKTNSITASYHADDTLTLPKPWRIASDPTAAIHKTAVPLSFTVNVPASLKSSKKSVVRTFYLIRMHDGQAQLLTNSNALKMTAKTDRFSTYLIAYKDTDPQSPASKTGSASGDKSSENMPETGDILPFITMLSAAAVGAAVTTWGLRRHAAQEEL